MEHPHALRLETDLEPEELRQRLDAWAPWGHRVEFSNGVSTADCRRRTPFSDAPLAKLAKVKGAIPLDTLDSALDVGCNSGHTAIELAGRYEMTVTGIDVQSRHIEVSGFLAGLAGVDLDLHEGNAETWVRPGSFDLVTHFGTLYHLPNPVKALDTAAENLRPRGWLALETQIYEDPQDEALCYWMRGHNEDPSNYWALSPSVLRECLTSAGFTKPVECFRVSPGQMADTMSRVVWVARKAGE